MAQQFTATLQYYDDEDWWWFRLHFRDKSGTIWDESYYPYDREFDFDNSRARQFALACYNKAVRLGVESAKIKAIFDDHDCFEGFLE